MREFKGQWVYAYEVMTLSDDLLEQYNYATDPVLTERLHTADRQNLRAMIAYGRDINTFGRQMTAHQNRVSKDGAAFLRFLGYSDKAAYNFRTALLFHDIGKTHDSYDPAIWSLPDRPTPEQKAAQKKHARLGADMFAEEHNDIKDHPHFSVRHAVTLLHHERIDGNGPEGIDISTLPRFVQVSCIIDAYDGDRIWRPHQPHRRTPREALERMLTDEKYKGAFNRELIEAYVTMKEQQHGINIL